VVRKNAAGFQGGLGLVTLNLIVILRGEKCKEKRKGGRDESENRIKKGGCFHQEVGNTGEYGKWAKGEGN